MEIKIGETIYYNGIKVNAVKANSCDDLCNGCFFRQNGICTRINYPNKSVLGYCSQYDREDGKDIIFKLINNSMIELKEQQVREAFESAKSDEVKEMLKSLFPDIAKEMEKKKPTLDDYTSIKSYEDACIALGEPRRFSEDYVMDMIGINGGMHFHIYGRNNISIENKVPVCKLPKHIIALMKLETIAKALWGRNWEPKPDASGDTLFWYPWFALWTEKEIPDLNKDQRGALLSAYATYGATAGFGYMNAYGRSSYATARIGFRLCQETEEKARYFGTQFVELWAEYLQLNFTTGERITVK